MSASKEGRIAFLDMGTSGVIFPRANEIRENRRFWAAGGVKSFEGGGTDRCPACDAPGRRVTDKAWSNERSRSLEAKFDVDIAFRTNLPFDELENDGRAESDVGVSTMKMELVLDDPPLANELLLLREFSANLAAQGTRLPSPSDKS